MAPAMWALTGSEGEEGVRRRRRPAAAGDAQGATAQDVITGAVDALRLARHESKRDLAAVLELAPPQVTRRYAGTALWTAADLERLARHFAVPYATLVTPPPGVITR